MTTPVERAVGRISELEAELQQLATERDANAQIGELMFERQQRWQEMAEDLWEELQEWHADTCPHHPAYSLKEPGECTCHRILAAKWNDLLDGDDYTDEAET